MREWFKNLALTAATLGLAGVPAGQAMGAGLTLTPAGVAQGLSLTTFATGFPTADFGTGPEGPLGIAFPTTGGVLVADKVGNVRLFPTDTDNQSAANAPIGQNYGVKNSLALAQLGSTIYMGEQNNNTLVQINNNGTFNQTILTGLTALTGIAADPFNGHLFIATTVGSGTIYDVNPIAKTATPFESVQADGLTLSPDGSVLYAAITVGSELGHILGFNTATKAQVYDSGFIPGGVDGAALGTGSFSGLLFVNTNGGTLYEVTLGSNPVQTLIASGGSRGDFVTVDPSTNTLLITQSDSILRLKGASFTVVPEPTSLLMAGTALLAGLGIARSSAKSSSRPPDDLGS
jgi:sugar lactone lactonase YvrE